VTALTVLIIRHAEKPGEAWPGPGLASNGVSDDKSPVIRGWQRAGAWASLFGGGLGGEDFPTPDIIYAANPNTNGSAHPDHGPSRRPFETVAPLAAKLQQKPVTKWAQGQEVELAAEVVKRTGTVLICWEHKNIISALLPAIASYGALKLSVDWPGDRFDVVLSFDRATASAGWQFKQLFPKLLSGDSDTKLGA